MPLPDGLSLDAVLDPMLIRLREEWLPNQPIWIRWSADAALDAAIRLRVDDYAEAAAKQAISIVRAKLEEAIDAILGGAPVPMFRVALSKQEGQALSAAGVNPTLLILGLQALLFIVERLKPYLARVAMAVDADGATSDGLDPLRVELTCDAATLEAVLNAEGPATTADNGAGTPAGDSES